MKSNPAPPVDIPDRVAHIEGELGSIRMDMTDLKSVLGKVWEKIDGLSTRGQPSWQAIVAFGFSAISALVTIGGVVGVVIAMFVRQETAAIAVRQAAQDKTNEELRHHVDRLRDEKVADLKEALRERKPPGGL